MSVPRRIIGAQCISSSREGGGRTPNAPPTGAARCLAGARQTRMCTTSRGDREYCSSTVRAVLKDLVPRDYAYADIGNPATRRQLPVEIACGGSQTLCDEVPGQTAVG